MSITCLAVPYQLLLPTSAVLQFWPIGLPKQCHREHRVAFDLKRDWSPTDFRRPDSVGDSPTESSQIPENLFHATLPAELANASIFATWKFNAQIRIEINTTTLKIPPASALLIQFLQPVLCEKIHR